MHRISKQLLRAVEPPGPTCCARTAIETMAHDDFGFPCGARVSCNLRGFARGSMAWKAWAARRVWAGLCAPARRCQDRGRGAVACTGAGNANSLPWAMWAL
jgi:hypothetical protein